MKTDIRKPLFIWLLNIALVLSLVAFPFMLMFLCGAVAEVSWGLVPVLIVGGLGIGLGLGFVLAVVLGVWILNLQRLGKYRLAWWMLIAIALFDVSAVAASRLLVHLARIIHSG